MPKPNARPFSPAPKPSKAKTVAKSLAKKPAAKKAAKKKTAAKPKPNTGLMCRKCDSKDITVSSQLVRRVREGKRVNMANCRCANGHEFQSKHPDAIKASRLADREKVATVVAVYGVVAAPEGGFAAQRAREKAASRTAETSTGADAGDENDDDDALDGVSLIENADAVEFDDEDEDEPDGNSGNNDTE